MENHKLQIPTGMQDTLPGECRVKRGLEEKLRRLFALSGFQEIETPILEYYNALDDATYGYRPEHVWKTFDRNGQVLAIRPDSTIPSVRLAAGRLKEEVLPLRLCYIQNMAKYTSDTLSMLCEQTQAGVELMGESSHHADAEVIALAIEALKTAGLRDFQIELGQAGFFQGFMQEAGLNEEQCEVMRGLVSRKDALGMVHEAGYYSGIIFQGQTASLGQPLLSGGRYDGLPSRFGREMPAVGFAVNLKLVLIALEKQGCSFEAPVPDLMLGFEQGCLRQAAAYACEKRAAGISGSLQYDAAPGELRARQQQGQCRQAAYITPEGIQCFGEETTHE